MAAVTTPSCLPDPPSSPLLAPFPINASRVSPSPLSSLRLLLPLVRLWCDQRAKQLVHVDEVVPIVVLVGGVMDGVVARSHDRIRPARHSHQSDETVPQEPMSSPIQAPQ